MSPRPSGCASSCQMASRSRSMTSAKPNGPRLQLTSDRAAGSRRVSGEPGDGIVATASADRTHPAEAVSCGRAGGCVLRWVAESLGGTPACVAPKARLECRACQRRSERIRFRCHPTLEVRTQTYTPTYSLLSCVPTFHRYRLSQNGQLLGRRGLRGFGFFGVLFGWVRGRIADRGQNSMVIAGDSLNGHRPAPRAPSAA